MVTPEGTTKVTLDLGPEAPALESVFLWTESALHCSTDLSLWERCEVCSSDKGWPRLRCGVPVPPPQQGQQLGVLFTHTWLLPASFILNVHVCFCVLGVFHHSSFVLVTTLEVCEVRQVALIYRRGC